MRNRDHGVAAYYDRLAPVYGEGEVFAARRAAVLNAVGVELANARVVLDLGCGNGAYGAEFVARMLSARVVGADLSPAMLHAARRRVGERMFFVQANAAALPFHGARFDLVFMSHVLQLVDDIDRCAAEVAACLVPGGFWVTTIGVSDLRATVLEVLGPEALQELAALVAPVRSGAAAADEARVTAACTRVGLQSTCRRAPFYATWAGIEEWLGIRWFAIADNAAQQHAEHWLAQVRPRAAGRMLSVNETLLVARKT